MKTSSVLPWEAVPKKFVPLLIINVHLISDVIYPGSFTITGFSYTFVCIIKWSSPAAIIPLTEVLSAINKSPLHLHPISRPPVRVWHIPAPVTSGNAPSASCANVFPCPQTSISPAADRTLPRSGRCCGFTGKRRMCAPVCVCPWDLLVKCFPFPGDIFDIKIKGQCGKQTDFPPPSPWSLVL